MRPSKLWKSLGATAPVFGVSDGSGQGATINDHRITGITITSGTAMAGLSTSSATVTVRDYQAYVPQDDDLPMWIRFSTYGANLLAAKLGLDPNAIIHRFTGRVIAHQVDDAGNSKHDGQPRLTTTLTGQDWLAFISQLDKGARADRDEPDVWRVYRSLFTHVTIPSLGTLQAWGSVWPWVRFTPEETGQYKDLTTSDVLTRYMADLGVLVRQNRAGYPTAHSHDHLIDFAQSWRTYSPWPLQRSQVLSPVQWTRPATIPTALYWHQSGPIGEDPFTGRAYGYAPSGNLTTRSQTVDMTHVWDTNWTPERSGFTDVMRARFYRERGTDLTVENVTVDLLALIRRATPADLGVAGQLLTMNSGDPIVLGYDWPLVRGLHFAQTIRHTITPTSWRVELTLVPAHHVIGSRVSDIAGATWETAYDPGVYWQSPTTPWKDVP